MDQIGDVDEPYTLGLDLREHNPQGLQGGRMRMADGNRLTLFARPPNGQVDLCLDGRDVFHVIKKRHVAKSSRNAVLPRRVVGHRSGGGSAIHVKQMVRP